MKRIKLLLNSLTAAAIAAGSIMAAPAMADDNAFSATLTLVRQQQVNNLAKRIADLSQRVENYILQTADTAPTMDKIDSYFNIPSTAWKNYDNGQLQFTVKDNQIVISNIFSQNEPQNVASLFQNDPYLPSIATVSDNTVYIPLSADIVTFEGKVNALKAVPGVFVGNGTPPSTATKWYQPTGDGKLVLYIKQSGTWMMVGENGNGNIVVDSEDDLKNIPVPVLGQKAFVKTSNGLQEYMYDGSGWDKVAGTSASTSSNSGGDIMGSADSPVFINTTYGAGNMDDLIVEAVKKKTGKYELLNGWYQFNGGKVVFIDWSKMQYALNGLSICLNGKCYNPISLSRLDKTKPNLVFHTWLNFTLNPLHACAETKAGDLYEYIGNYNNGDNFVKFYQIKIADGGNIINNLVTTESKYGFFLYYTWNSQYCYIKYELFANQHQGEIDRFISYINNNCIRTLAYQIPVEPSSSVHYYGAGIAYIPN